MPGNWLRNQARNRPACGCSSDSNQWAEAGSSGGTPEKCHDPPSAQARREKNRRREKIPRGYPGRARLCASRTWRKENRQIEIELHVRNLLGRDLLASHARPGAGRELVFAARASL